MENNNKFSKRFGYTNSIKKEIVVRDDAPVNLRVAVILIAYDAGLNPSTIRMLICRVLRERPNPRNWSEYPNIDQEVNDLIDNCDWFKVYDIIEAIYDILKEERYLRTKTPTVGADYLSKEINKLFLKEGIGWQLKDGQIQIRGTESFEETTKKAIGALNDAEKETASHEIHQALSDLSRRPTPDITGAIQHSLAALECVARDISGNPKGTLGEILKNFPDLIPSPLDKSIEKIWGYASEHGRHLREGRTPKIEEAELLVGIASATALYLIKKDRDSKSK